MLLENNPYQTDGRVRHEAEALLRAGYRVSVISPRPRRAAASASSDGPRLYQYPAPPDGDGLLGYVVEYGWSMVMAFALAWVALLREGFDVIHAHNPPDTFVLIGAFFKLFGKRFVFDHHDLAPEMYAARLNGDGSQIVRRALLLFERASCRLADRVIATNGAYQRLAVERHGVPAARVTIVRNGPDLIPLPEPAPPTASEHGVTLIGYAGVIGRQDGVEYAIRAMHHLAHDLAHDLGHDLGRAHVILRLIGDGDALPALKQLAAALDVSAQIEFCGWIAPERVAGLLRETALCLAPEPSNPYHDRCTTIKIMEYMMLGKPVVAFDLPEHRVSAQDAALYARPNDPRDMAFKIAQLLDDAALRRRMGALGRRRVEQTLAWEHQEPHLLHVYAEVLPTKRGRG